MKVALIADSFQVEEGTGIARYASELLNGLIDKGIDVKPISIEPPLKSGGIINHVVRLPYNVLKEIHDCDLVHFTSPATAFSIPFIKIPKVTTYHDLTSILCKNCGVTFHTKISAPIIYRIVGMYSDFTIAISTQTKNEMIENLKIHSEKIQAIPLGIDPKYIHIEKNNTFFTIGYLGALVKRKRIDYLLKCFSQLKILHPDLNVRLVICGKKSPECLRLIELSKKLNIFEYVEYKGFVKESELVDVYNCFDIFIIPSDWEGFCLPLMECQKCGVPVIIREDAHIPEEVSKCCLKASSEEDMAEKVYQLLTNSELKRDIIKKGLIYSKQFTWERTAEDTINIYKKCL